MAVALLSTVPAALAAVVHDSALDWYSLQGPHFIVHYPEGAEAQAREALAVAERVHARLSPIFHWQPQAPTEIVLSDEFDLSNGAATFFPDDRIWFWLAPPDDVNSLEDHAGWIETVIQHEYTHILHLDKARGAPKTLRNIFGRFFGLFPNSFEPIWLIEGLAVHYETDKARGIGRGQSSLFDMYMRMEVDGGMKPLRQINQDVDTWPSGIVPYLYGVQFYDYLSNRYGEDSVQRWVENYSGNIIPFRILSNSQKTVGQPLDRVWEEFAREREQHYRAQLAALRTRGEQAGERVSHDGYAASQARALPDGTVFYTAFDGRNAPALMVLRPGESRARRLADIQSGARLDAHPTAGVLVAQPELCRNARLHYDLYRIDARDGDITRLTHCARYRHAAWHPDGGRIAAVQYALGRSRLDLLDADGRFIETLWQGMADEVIGDLDWSPDAAEIVAAVWRRDGGWNLELFSLAQRHWRGLTKDAAIDTQPRFSRDGKSILFSSDHGGVYNLRRFDLAAGRVTTLSNVAGGAFYPTEANAGTIYYIGYDSRGFNLYRLEPASLPTPSAPPGPSGVAESPPEPVAASIKDYSPWSGLRPRYWLPHLVVDSGRTEIGATTSGADPLFRHNYAVDAAYDYSLRSPVGSIDYVYDRWWPVLKLHAMRENIFTRNDNGDIMRVRHDDNYQAEAVLPRLKLDSRFSLHAAAVMEKESDAELELGAAAKADTKDALVGIAAIWDSTKQYPLSVSRSHGREWRFVAEDSDAFNGDFSGRIYTADLREFIALGGEHVLALRFVEGWGTENPRPFKLGGSQGSVPAAPILGDTTFDTPFNVRRYPLRGYPEGVESLEGRRMRLATLEWRFPIRRVERGFMTPPAALHQLSGTFFVDNGGTWNDDGHSPAHRRTGAGFELNADTAIFYSLRFALRLGFAHGFNDDGENQVYLRIGSSF